MKARIGFVLFIGVFLVMAIVSTIGERIMHFIQQTYQSFYVIAGAIVQGTQSVTKKISMEKLYARAVLRGK